MWIYIEGRIGKRTFQNYFSWHPRVGHRLKMLFSRQYRERWNEEIPF